MLPNSEIRQNVDSKRTEFERGNSAERAFFHFCRLHIFPVDVVVSLPNSTL